MWIGTFTVVVFLLYHVNGQGGGQGRGFDPRAGRFGGDGQLGGGMDPTFVDAPSTPARPGQCPADRRIDGYICGGGRGDNVINCPSGSECIADRMIGSPVCCWTETSTVSAPCEDPMMNGNEFVTCSQGRRSCPGNCHTCEILRGLGSGLCCPQVNRAGCERSSPMRNQFEDSRRRILSMGDTGSTTSGDSMTSGTGMSGMDSSTSNTPPRVGMDFGMSNRGSPRRQCPGGSVPISACSRTSPCRAGMTCIAVTRMSGMCCPVPGRTSTFGRPGVRPPVGPGVMGGRGMMMRPGMPGMGMPGSPGGFPPRGPGGFPAGGPGGIGGRRPPFMGPRF